MIGKRISPVLVEIESSLWDFEAVMSIPPQYTDEGFRAALKVFMSAMMDKMWRLQNNEEIPMALRAEMAQKLGDELRALVKNYADVDTSKLYDHP
jgi:hypothetical protein